MAGRNMRLKAMVKVVAGMQHRFKANKGPYGLDFDGWVGFQCGGYKLVWKSPCGGFVVKMTRKESPYRHGAGAEADFYASLPVALRVFFPVTIKIEDKVGEDMSVQPCGDPGPEYYDEIHSPEERKKRKVWSEACSKLRHAMEKVGLFNYDLTPKNIARFGKRYKLIDFASSERDMTV